MNEKSKKVFSAIRQNMAENYRQIRNFIRQKKKQNGQKQSVPYSVT